MAKKSSQKKGRSARSVSAKSPRTASSRDPARVTAVVGLIFAILSLLVFPIIMGFIGLILGIVAAVLGNKSGNKKDLHFGLLVIGLSIVLPFVSLILVVLIASMLG